MTRDLFRYIVALACVYALAWVVADSKLSLAVREKLVARIGAGLLVLFLECVTCLGFYIALFVAGVILRLGFFDSIVFALVYVPFSLVLWRIHNE